MSPIQKFFSYHYIEGHKKGGGECNLNSKFRCVRVSNVCKICLIYRYAFIEVDQSMFYLLDWTILQQCTLSITTAHTVTKSEATDTVKKSEGKARAQNFFYLAVRCRRSGDCVFCLFKVEIRRRANVCRGMFALESAEKSAPPPNGMQLHYRYLEGAEISGNAVLSPAGREKQLASTRFLFACVLLLLLEWTAEPQLSHGTLVHDRGETILGNDQTIDDVIFFGHQSCSSRLFLFVHQKPVKVYLYLFHSLFAQLLGLLCPLEVVFCANWLVVCGDNQKDVPLRQTADWCVFRFWFTETCRNTICLSGEQWNCFKLEDNGFWILRTGDWTHACWQWDSICPRFSAERSRSLTKVKGKLFQLEWRMEWTMRICHSQFGKLAVYFDFPF